MVSDNGTELTSNAILRWSEERRVGWHYIAPGKPMRDRPLPRASSVGSGMSAGNEHLFRGLGEARRLIAAWRYDYNLHRPHTSLCGLTPRESASTSKSDHARNRTNF